MKNFFKIYVVILALFISGCAATPSGGNQQSAAIGDFSSSTTVAGIDELDIAIREASDYLNGNIPRGSKIVILNIESNSPDLSDYIIDELIANAVNDKFFTVVDRQQLDAIRSEQNFQMSGEVDDNDALSIGRFFGAQTIVSGAVSSLGTGYRIRIRALDVQTAQVQGQYNHNIAASPIINSLMASGGSAPGSSTAGGSTAQAQSTTPDVQTTPAVPNQPASSTPTQPVVPAPALIVGTPVPGASLSEKLAWLQRSADSHNTYILELNADENIAPTILEYSGAINITIVLRGINANRTVRLRSNGTMFEVGSNVTLILENNITLQGHSGNNGPIVYTEAGTFIMNTGSTITGNTNTQNMGGGVYIKNNGTFTMNGGTISGNTAYMGGGVLMDAGLGMNGGIFIMNGGTISGNTVSWSGGGVYISKGTFTMNGGSISGNNASDLGGGVFAGTYITFTMNGGTISGNTANKGGGAYVSYSINMRGGTISSNIARENGGGVYFDGGHGTTNFNKTGGTITGYNSDQSNGNVVGAVGNPLSRRGHAVWVGKGYGDDPAYRKETTAGPTVNLNSGSNTGWD